MGLDDRQSRQGTTTQFIRQLGCPLQQSRVQIKYIPRIRFTARWTAKKQGHGAVCHRVLRQIIVHDEYVLAVLHPLLSHGAASVGCDILQGRQFAGRGGNHRRIIHGPMFIQVLHQLRDGRSLLPDGHIDAQYILAPLVDDRVHGDRCLSRLPVSNDQFPLSSSDGHHGVNGL